MTNCPASTVREVRAALTARAGLTTWLPKLAVNNHRVGLVEPGVQL